MLDFSPQNLSEYDRELITARYDIRSWLAYVAPLLKKNNLLILLLPNFELFSNKFVTKMIGLFLPSILLILKCMSRNF